MGETWMGGGGPKVVIVGGGGYRWGPKLVLDVAASGHLRGGKLTVYDTGAEALDDAFRWGERAVGLAGSGLKVEKAGRLDEALRGADFVVLSISTGGLEAMAHDLEIPDGYGVVQTVGDTVGPGGIFRALRNIPVVVGIAREMEGLCPDAVLLNLTNPLTALTRAVTKTTSVRTIGLCHELFGTLEVLAEEFGVPEHRLEVEAAGVNHYIWIRRVVAAGGRDVTGETRQVTEGKVRDAVLERVAEDPATRSSTAGASGRGCAASTATCRPPATGTFGSSFPATPRMVPSASASTCGRRP